MWALAMFDLPVDTKDARRRYARFRKMLINDGFMMLQYSVYGRPCPSEENAGVHLERVKRALPTEGQVRLLMMTDMQFARMQVYLGKTRVNTEKPPEQLSMF
jgi:CRISPR-associated protein Cas2